MRRKDIRKKAFAKIMSPQCPQCKEYDADTEVNVTPAFLRASDFRKLIEGKLKTNVHTCRKCGTVWQDNGYQIRCEK